MAVEDVNFLDMACLMKIGPETVMEKFGGLINTSFFDASTIAGTLKQKDLIEFSNDFPGPNGIKVTAAGKALISEAEVKSAEPFDMLDSSILQQMSGGKRLPFELANSLNIRGKDLAFRLYKLYKQNYIIYDLKNGGVELLLTEGGFLKVKDMPLSAAQSIGVQKAQTAGAMNSIGKMLGGNAPPQQEQAAGTMQQGQKKGGSGKIMVIGIVIVLIVIIALYAVKSGLIGGY